MSISKFELADQIVHARHGFVRNDQLSLDVLQERCCEVFNLRDNYSKKELLQLRAQIFAAL